MARRYRFSVESVDGRSDVEVNLVDTADISALADALAMSAEDMIIDGKSHLPWTTLDDAGVLDGSLIALDVSIPGSESSKSTLRLSGVLDQIAGVAGSGSIDFSVGSATLDGTSVEAGRTGSFTVHPKPGPVVVDNAIITEPTQLGSNVLNLGSTRYRAHIATKGREGGDRTHRRPPSIVRRVSPPTLPQLGPSRRVWSWAIFLLVAAALGVLGLVAPVAFAAAGVALVAGLGVLILNRRSRLREVRKHRATTERLIDEFRVTVERQRHSVESELRAANLSIPELARAAGGAGARPPNRVVGDHDFGRVSVGYGELDWAVQVDSLLELPTPFQRVVAANNRLTSVPLVADMTRGPIGIVGARAECLSIARALLLSLASSSLPADIRLSIAVEPEGLDEWDWVKWLPHIDHDHGVVTSSSAAESMVSTCLAGGRKSFQVVVMEQLEWALNAESLLRPMGRGVGMHGFIVLATDSAELPECPTLIEVHADGTATLALGEAKPLRFVTPVGASSSLASDVARGIAGQYPARSASASGVRIGEVQLFKLEPIVVASAVLTPPPIPMSAQRRPVVDAERSEGPRRTLIFPPPIPAEHLAAIDLRPESLGPHGDIDLDDASDNRWNRSAPQ